MSFPRYALRISVLLCAVMLRGAETETKAPAAEERSLDAAKRDFDALKASRTTMEQGRMALPQINGPVLPETGAVPTPPPTTASDPKALKAQEKSRNWLLEAMEQTKRDSRSKELGKDRDLKDDRDRHEETAGQTAEPDARRLGAKAEREALRDGSLRVENPLDAYMAGWISPRDHEALLPQRSDTPMLDASLAPLLHSPETSLPAANLPDARSQKMDPISFGGWGETPTDNPYLKPDPAPAPALSLPAPLPPTNAPTESKMPATEPLGPVKNPAPAMDPGKPAQDAKYFPQLKRF